MDKLSTKNIVVWVPRFWPAMGGTELHSYELSCRLAVHSNIEIVTHCDTTADKERSLYTDVLNTLSKRYKLNKLLVNRIGLSRINYPLVRWIAQEHENFKFARPLFTMVFRTFARFDVENTHLIHFIYNGLTDAAEYASKCAHKNNIPFIFTPNVLNTEDTPSAWNSKRFKKLYKHADAIIALTEHEAQYLQRQGADPKKISIIPYGPVIADSYNANRARKLLNVKQEKIVLFLGRVVKLKGFELLLEAFDQIKETHPNTVLVFMGPATDSVKTHLEKQKHRRIVFIDTADQQLKTDMLAACDLLCLPSFLESLGVVYLEAFACGKPVVALDMPVLRDVISHNKDGILVAPHSNAIASAVSELLSNPTKAQKMGAHGLEKVKQHYSWDAVVESVLAVYSKAIDRKTLER